VAYLRISTIHKRDSPKKWKLTSYRYNVNMDKCLLCKKKEANKTGSHIIPSFLMKRINGGRVRDHEVGFVISVSGVTRHHP
jgi:hypothetical protein